MLAKINKWILNKLHKFKINRLIRHVYIKAYTHQPIKCIYCDYDRLYWEKSQVIDEIVNQIVTCQKCQMPVARSLDYTWDLKCYQ